MNHTTVAAAAAALAFALVPRTPLAAQEATAQGSHWSWHGQVATGKSLEIRGINGDIVAEAGTGNEVVVTADKHARRSDPDDVRIQVVQDGDGVLICAVYPGSSNRCARDDDYHMNTHDNDVQVDFHAQVPAGIAFAGHNVNGDVEASDLAARVDAATVNGGVRISTTAGDASATTVNGSVTAEVRGQGDGRLNFKTVNGSVTVTLPKSLNADLEAHTVNGSIETDYPITVQGRLTPRRLEGRIGQGGRDLRLETVNGSIRIRASQ